ncbi:MAG: undecaprenyl-diphosphate phosphatase [Lachnospiraceae bacterium]|nr:undecaprenyl-diphosphate phosphatase [Lachnospiraceae bacterium]MCI9150219.1 undecaprenyl-diphosphate phosphatase [Lachnospiraceae bacterium]
MSLLQSIVMGLIQGLTEFLPVSSSGHLAIFKNIFQVNTETGILFDILLHLGTLVAIFAVYYRDIFKLIAEGFGILGDACCNIGIFFKHTFGKKETPYKRVIKNGYRKFVMLVIVSTIPTGIIGFVARDLVEAASEFLFIPGICLIITAVLLLISDRVPDGAKTPKNVTYTNAFGVGICQGLATMPGLSRSGTTITACVISGFDRNFAVKYSFIMSIPAILGAAVLELGDVGSVEIPPTEILYYVVGMVVAAVVGFICMKTLLVIVRKKKFTYFAIYCLLIGAVSIGGYFIV